MRYSAPQRAFDFSLWPLASELFRQDAAFKMVPGLADGSWSSFESVNFPGHYIRHKNFHLHTERGNDDLFRKDSTFRVAPPDS